MSYAELQDLSSLMVQLGFPRPVSVDSFRAPNFGLMSACLFHLVSAIAPDCGLAYDVQTPEDRAYFVATAVSLAQAKARVRLNARRLYASDAAAARELRKLAAEVSEYLSVVVDTAVAGADETYMVIGTHTTALRQAAATLVDKSTRLLAGLRSSADVVGAALTSALSIQPDGAALPSAVQRRIRALEGETARLEDELTTNRREKNRLAEQLSAKTRDLAQVDDRLDALRVTKPPYLAELESLEAELARLHLDYARKYRSLSFLGSQLQRDEYREMVRLQKMESGLKQIQSRAQLEEAANLYTGFDSTGGSQKHASDADALQETPSPFRERDPRVPRGGVAPAAPRQGAPPITSAAIPDEEPPNDEDEYEYESYDDDEDEDAGVSAPIPSQAPPASGAPGVPGASPPARERPQHQRQAAPPVAPAAAAAARTDGEDDDEYYYEDEDENENEDGGGGPGDEGRIDANAENMELDDDIPDDIIGDEDLDPENMGFGGEDLLSG